MMRLGKGAVMRDDVGYEAALSARPLDPNVKQRLASDPDMNIWVNASAGTGKTKVLTDRVLRLLLPRNDGRPGTDPRKILCITFTKAGANEMIMRVQETLAQWVVLPVGRGNEVPGTLRFALFWLLGRSASRAQIDAAQQLFRQVVDLPGGLKIMTIHAFCQSVLARFPLEAGISPQMEMLDAQDMRAYLEQAKRDVCIEAAAEGAEGSDIADAVRAVSRCLNEGQLDTIVSRFAGERDAFQRLCFGAGGAAGLWKVVCRDQGVSCDMRAEDVACAAVQEGEFDRQALTDAARSMLAGGAAGDVSRAEALCCFLEADGAEARLALFDRYCGAYLKKDGALFARLVTKAGMKQCAQAGDILRAEAERIVGVVDVMKALKNCELTVHVMVFAEAVLVRYQALKAARGALDFDDQILKTLGLLRMRADWVLYKLDQGIEHILLDEAQDTNPEQWQIIAALYEEFFAHGGAEGASAAVRTVFVVGDEKQSIYGFQRASPQMFAVMRERLKAMVSQAGYRWADVDLEISFRSTPSVLAAVDCVFASEEMRTGVSRTPVHHMAFRRTQAGHVELWPLIEEDKRDVGDVWEGSKRPVDIETASVRLARDIAERLAGWFRDGHRLEAYGRPVRPGDVMVLVRTRTVFVHHLMRALKQCGIPVSGADRMVLTDHIAVQDMLALAEFCLLPEDDLNLAGLLKSPLIGLDEEAVFALAHGREGSVWAALQMSAHDDVCAYLLGCREDALRVRPYEFFNRVLYRACPGSDASGVVAFKNRLGEDCASVLQDFAGMALAFERSHIPTLQAFCVWLSGMDHEITREAEAARDEVRIMTVHGSKGLQAPVVILPDTLRSRWGSASVRETAQRLLWPDKTGFAAPIWSPVLAQDHALYRAKRAELRRADIEEDKRLLYVAMTRAEERVYVAGYAGKRAPVAESWYFYVRDALRNDRRCVVLEDGGLRMSNPRMSDPDRVDVAQGVDAEEACVLPDWVDCPALPESRLPRPFAPSQIGNAAWGEAVRYEVEGPSDGGRVLPFLALGREESALRGRIIHKLLEILPVLPVEAHEGASMEYLAAQRDVGGCVFSSEVCDRIWSDVCGILQHPDYGVFFSDRSVAEVPVVADIEGYGVISGVIDRLCVAEDTVWILDYKTGQPPEDLETGVPQVYVYQMEAYKRAVALLYPGRTVQGVMMWTHGPLCVKV